MNHMIQRRRSLPLAEWYYEECMVISLVGALLSTLIKAGTAELGHDNPKNNLDKNRASS